MIFLVCCACQRISLKAGILENIIEVDKKVSEFICSESQFIPWFLRRIQVLLILLFLY
jgi:hypothetical protein